MKAKVDPDVCIACGACTGICPEIFSMGDEGFSVAKEGEIEESLIGSAQEAEETCPVDAITVE
ncbi:MAG: ferredoxin [Clostridioides sp.]|jgi:ferredoxin|nr:ferredoxin [Clostridioides sp.]